MTKAHDAGKLDGYEQGCGMASASHWDAYMRTCDGTPGQGWRDELDDYTRGFAAGVDAWKTAHPYSVLEFGSHPEAGNDDCYTGTDFATLDEARAAFVVDPSDTGVAFVMLDGPDVNEVRRIPGYRAERHSNDKWRREIATQAGMAGGCDAYNDATGYS